MADQQLVAAGLGAMNLFGTLLLGWIIVVAAAIYLTHPQDSEGVAYSTPPLAVVGSLGYASLVTVFYGAERAFLAGFTQVPAQLKSFEAVLIGFLVLTSTVFVLLVTKPLADSVSPAFERRMDDARQAAFAAYGASFVFETALVAGTVFGLLRMLPSVA